MFLENKVAKTVWCEIYLHCQKDGYLLPTVEFCITRVGLKMLSLNLIDDCLHLAFRLKNKQLVGAAKRAV
jgi:hypothetical protein